jgi:hypothetical protein
VVFQTLEEVHRLLSRTYSQRVHLDVYLPVGLRGVLPVCVECH